MKKITSLLSIMALTAVFSTSALAQQSASATTAPTTTTIVAPITISNTAALTFGSFATTSEVGTLKVATDGVRSKTGGVTLTSNNVGGTAASFTVGGEAGYSYAISIPTSLSLTTTTVATGTGTTASSQTMTVNSLLTSLADGARVGLLTGGTQSFTIGGTLNVNAYQSVGAYTSATGLTVTVNYN
ncbi:DUF4402 domain-containing protein [Flavobacterium sp. LB2P6]|uniref:DUF4402 domain-containing protein n=1 Tax=Flavobacterium sp. LB2P6 TaxID=3401714 RepID=UPI003AABE9BC